MKELERFNRFEIEKQQYLLHCYSDKGLNGGSHEITYTVPFISSYINETDLVLRRPILWLMMRKQMGKNLRLKRMKC